VKNTREERKEKKEARIIVSETAHRSRHRPAARARVDVRHCTARLNKTLPFFCFLYLLIALAGVGGYLIAIYLLDHTITT
jgi:hypothetical protein